MREHKISSGQGAEQCVELRMFCEDRDIPRFEAALRQSRRIPKFEIEAVGSQQGGSDDLDSALAKARERGVSHILFPYPPILCVPGDLNDAMAFLDHLSSLGVNAVELLPMSQFDGIAAWGYGDSHHFAIQSSAGGRDEYRLFVRECHRRGIAVIQDVVYNHFDSQAERAEWHYDSDAENNNIYYWYEGMPSQYQDPEGGYLDNGSSGWTPRFWEERVRSYFVSSAAAFIKEFHVDGFRVDLTDAIHQNNCRHSDGTSVGNANQFGSKFLREWSRTLRVVVAFADQLFLLSLAFRDWDNWVPISNSFDLLSLKS